MRGSAGVRKGCSNEELEFGNGKRITLGSSYSDSLLLHNQKHRYNHNPRNNYKNGNDKNGNSSNSSGSRNSHNNESMGGVGAAAGSGAHEQRPLVGSSS